MNWDYIAGWFDGEGCVHFKKKEHQYVLSFANTDYNVLKEIRNFFYDALKIDEVNITEYTPRNKKRNSDYKIMYRLMMSRHQDVIKILWYLKEKCITKKNSCEMAYKYEIDACRMIKKRWKEEDRNYLRENYKGYGDVVKIAKYLGRTYASTENEVERLNLRDEIKNANVDRVVR